MEHGNLNCSIQICFATIDLHTLHANLHSHTMYKINKITIDSYVLFVDFRAAIMVCVGLFVCVCISQDLTRLPSKEYLRWQ